MLELLLELEESLEIQIDVEDIDGGHDLGWRSGDFVASHVATDC